MLAPSARVFINVGLSLQEAVMLSIYTRNCEKNEFVAQDHEHIYVIINK